MNLERKVSFRNRLNRFAIGALTGLALFSSAPSIAYAQPKFVAGGEARFYQKDLEVKEEGETTKAELEGQEYTGHLGVELFNSRVGLYGLAGVLASADGKDESGVTVTTDSSFLYGGRGFVSVPLGRLNERPESTFDLTRGWDLRAEGEYRRASTEVKGISFEEFSVTPEDSEFTYNDLYAGGSISRLFPITDNISTSVGVAGGYNNTFGEVSASAFGESLNAEFDSETPVVVKPFAELNVTDNFKVKATGYFGNQTGGSVQGELRF